MKFKDIAVYENNLDKFNIGHCQSKVKVIVGLDMSDVISTFIFKYYHDALPPNLRTPS